MSVDLGLCCPWLGLAKKGQNAPLKCILSFSRSRMAFFLKILVFLDAEPRSKASFKTNGFE